MFSKWRGFCLGSLKLSGWENGCHLFPPFRAAPVPNAPNTADPCTILAELAFNSIFCPVCTFQRNGWWCSSWYHCRMWESRWLRWTLRLFWWDRWLRWVLGGREGVYLFLTLRHWGGRLFGWCCRSGWTRLQWWFILWWGLAIRVLFFSFWFRFAGGVGWSLVVRISFVT